MATSRRVNRYFHLANVQWPVSGCLRAVRVASLWISHAGTLFRVINLLCTIFYTEMPSYATCFVFGQLDVTVVFGLMLNARGCEFDSHSRKYFYSFLRSSTNGKRDVELRHSKRNASKMYYGNWGAESVLTLGSLCLPFYYMRDTA